MTAGAVETACAPQGPIEPRVAAESSCRLKIAFVHDGLYPHFKGGAERRFYETARLLTERHDVTYITWQYWDGPAVSEDAGIRLLGVGEAQPFYGGDGKRTIKEALAFAGRAARVLAGQRFDVVDCCATPLLAVYVTWLTARWRREPLVVTWHEFWGEYWQSYQSHRPAVARVAQAIEAGAVARADSLVAVSQFTARKLSRLVPSRPLRVVENGVSLGAIERAPPAADAPDVLFAGRLIDDKRVDLLLEAIAVASTRLPSLTCAVVGEGPERGRLENQARSLGIEDRVRFLGFLEEQDLYGLMRGSKVFVLPSVREGFGLAVIEAQASSAVPVVVRAPYNAAVDLVEDGVDGVVCLPEAGSLAGALLGLLTDEARRQRLATNARRSAASRDWARVTERMEAIYLGLALRSERRVA